MALCKCLRAIKRHFNLLEYYSANSEWRVRHSLKLQLFNCWFST